jgi:hypothetical protein
MTFFFCSFFRYGTLPSTILVRRAFEIIKHETCANRLYGSFHLFKVNENPKLDIWINR